MQFGARRDPEFGEEVIQMGANRAMRQIESLADLTVGESLGGPLGDLEVLRRELIARVGGAGTPSASNTSRATRSGARDSATRRWRRSHTP